ncbi:hypothetical protein KGQ90_10735 [Modicisalibacter tunisiensis]|uniref:hypothetical protein n=1 Tax=Modicisalibacter tunisiensis TaxID=390637 RepID=UPI001CCE1150|nr:hypothetical protein [Modicisalibacter tunisiensis]MBZ9539408.1 hypothetical protein [Modicisalibacter tunisiensis]
MNPLARITVVRLLGVVFLGGLTAGFGPPSRASGLLTYDHGLIQTSLWTHHYSSDTTYNDRQNLIGIELHNPDRWLAGAAWLKNSFDQPTWYFYAGREFPLWRPRADLEVRAKLTAGGIRGYDGDKRNKIAYNHYGIAPAILPTVGVRWGRVESDAILFGTAGLMVTAGVRF